MSGDDYREQKMAYAPCNSTPLKPASKVCFDAATNWSTTPPFPEISSTVISRGVPKMIATASFSIKLGPKFNLTADGAIALAKKPRFPRLAGD